MKYGNEYLRYHAISFQLSVMFLLFFVMLSCCMYAMDPEHEVKDLEGAIRSISSRIRRTKSEPDLRRMLVLKNAIQEHRGKTGQESFQDEESLLDRQMTILRVGQGSKRLSLPNK